MAERLIGEVAREFGVNRRTLRYYETLRLLPPPRRSRGGYRLYDKETDRRLAFISKAKALGLTLKEIQVVLAVANGNELPCNSVKQILSDHVRRIDQQMAQLRSLKSEMQSMLAKCPSDPRSNRKAYHRAVVCPIIEDLSNGTHKIKNGGGRDDQDLLALPGVQRVSAD